MRLKHDDGFEINEASIGDGPMHNILSAFERATGHVLTIQNFHIHSLSNGGDAQGQASIIVDYQGREVRGNGVSTDIVEAAALAALEVVNRIERIKLPKIPVQEKIVEAKI